MKRLIALTLCIAMLLSGCGVALNENETNASEQSQQIDVSSTDLSEVTIDFADLSDEELLEHVEETVYNELEETLDPEQFYIDEVSAAYVSKEYLEESEFNSQSNIFFGYSLADLDAQFQGSRYIFTLDESGQTAVEELVEVNDDTYNKIVKGVLIGAGIILVSVAVAAMVSNPAIAVAAKETVKIIFTLSAIGKIDTIVKKSADIGAAAYEMIEAVKAKDTKQALKSGALCIGEGINLGAIIWCNKGKVAK